MKEFKVLKAVGYSARYPMDKYRITTIPKTEDIYVQSNKFIFDIVKEFFPDVIRDISDQMATNCWRFQTYNFETKKGLYVFITKLKEEI